MECKFTVNAKGKPPTYIPISSNDRRKLADCELHFGDDEGLFAGLKIQGFVIWERVKATETLPVGNLSVTPPNFREPTFGDRSISFIRPVEDMEWGDNPLPKGPLGIAILNAFKEWRNSQQDAA